MNHIDRSISADIPGHTDAMAGGAEGGRQAGGANQNSDAGVDLWSIVGFVRRQFLLVIGTALAVLFLAALVTFQLTPRYTATSLVLVDPRAQRLVDVESLLAAPATSGVIDSEVEVLRSDTVLRRAINTANLADAPEFAESKSTIQGLRERFLGADGVAPNPEVAETRLVERLRDNLRITRRGVTFVISVAATNDSPVLAARVANSVAQAYIDDQIDAKIIAARDAETALAARVQEIGTDLRTVEASLDEFLLTAAAEAPQVQPASPEEIASVTTELQRLAQERQALSREAVSLAEALRSGNASSAVEATSDETLAALEGRRVDLAQELQTLIDQRATGREQVEAALSTVERDIVGAAGTRRDALQGRLAQIEAESLEARRSLSSLIGTDGVSGAISLELFKLQQEAETTRALYQAALERLKQAQTNASVQVADARVLSKAATPLDPSFPPTFLFFALALFGGAGLGLTLGFLREQFFVGFVEAERLERVAGIPVVSVVPRVSARGETPAPELDVIERPLSPYTEAIRRWLLSIEAAAGDVDKCLVILVTSANENEGKSTLAVSLGRTIAASGRKTLLIDGDLRKPSVAKLLEIPKEAPVESLIDFATGRLPIERIDKLGYRDQISGLDVFCNRTPASEATDRVVAGPLFSHLMVKAREHYDVVVIDSPPLLPVVDGRILLRYADAVTLTVRFAITPASDVTAAVRELDQPGSPPILSVLNAAESHGRGFRYGRYGRYGYRGYRYGYGYAYGAEESK